MIRSYRAVAWALIAAVFSSPVFSAEIVGMVKTSKGQVTIERGNQRLVGAVGTMVEISDRLRTGQNSAAGITLRDNTLLSAGPNSLIVIDKFAFDTTSQVGNMSIAIRKGTLSVATGKIAKKTPESVDFHTPTSVLGVRGTEFVIEVGEGSDE